MQPASSPLVSNIEGNLMQGQRCKALACSPAAAAAPSLLM
jgi:hypothetical protein